jgi:hypothetical protein
MRNACFPGAATKNGNRQKATIAGAGTGIGTVERCTGHVLRGAGRGVSSVVFRGDAGGLPARVSRMIPVMTRRCQREKRLWGRPGMEKSPFSGRLFPTVGKVETLRNFSRMLVDFPWPVPRILISKK